MLPSKKQKTKKYFFNNECQMMKAFIPYNNHIIIFLLLLFLKLIFVVVNYAAYKNLGGNFFLNLKKKMLKILFKLFNYLKNKTKLINHEYMWNIWNEQDMQLKWLIGKMEKKIKTKKFSFVNLFINIIIFYDFKM